MLNFVLHNPTRVIFGPGETEKIGIEAGKIGKKALIVTGRKSSSSHGILNRITKFLDDENVKSVIFNRVKPNPRHTTIDEAGKIARDENCDMIIGLGGGSPMDAAKAIAISAATGHPIWDYVRHGQPIPKPVTKALPIIEIPTLAATGSESNSGAVISNWETHEKAVLFDPHLFPRFCIIDPELTITVPRDYTIDGGIDIITHVIESFFTGVENTPLQDRLGLSIIKTVMDYLPIAMNHPDDINARSQLSWCSAVALIGVINTGRGGGFPLHAMEHALSAYYDISHGRGLALLLPHLMEYTYKSRLDKFVFMARELYAITDNSMNGVQLAEAAISKTIEFLESVDRYITMSDVDINDDTKFSQMAEDTIRIYSPDKKSLINPRPLFTDDIVEIFRMCQ